MNVTKNEQSVQTMTATDVRQHFASAINQVARQQSQIVIEKSGVPVAALVSINDLLRLRSLETQDPEIAAVFEMMSKPFRGVPPEEIETETERILAEISEEDREERPKAASG